jgi:hypothetical protein
MSDYTMFRGDSLVLYLAVQTQDGKAQDITGAKLWMTAKKAVGDADQAAVFQITTDAPPGAIVITNAQQGLVAISVPPSSTAALPAAATRLYYDVQVKLSNGTIQTIEAGQLTVNPDVTRAT